MGREHRRDDSIVGPSQVNLLSISISIHPASATPLRATATKGLPDDRRQRKGLIAASLPPARPAPSTPAKWCHRPNERSSARTQRSCLRCGPTYSRGLFRRLPHHSYPASFHLHVTRRMTAPAPARPPPIALNASPSDGPVAASSYVW